MAVNRKVTLVARAYGNIPAILAGTKNDTYGIRNIFFPRVAEYVYGQIHYAYILKSEGIADELGNKWPDITQKTKAQRPIRKGDKTLLGLSKAQTGTKLEDRKRGLLTPSEDKLWRYIFSRYMNQFILTMDEGSAKARAAKIAWKVLKDKGAKTKLEVLGNRDLLIMRVTDRLLKSLEPSKVGTSGYRPKKDQIYNVQQGVLTIGSTVEYAKFHSKRPPIPDNIDPWIDEAIDYAMTYVLRHMTEKVR